MAFVGYSVFDIHIQNVHSLKEKRFVLRSVKDRIAQKFNVAVSETGHQDKWQRCELAVAAVAGERRSVERTLEGVRAMLDCEAELRVISDESDIL
ncbi:MAG TPA: DUF503 domain-containing protein [Gemmatimonadota bacterium]|jgi:uncharacterized protein YlxP (DUF503 family)